jgi:hypothetical protein
LPPLGPRDDCLGRLVCTLASAADSQIIFNRCDEAFAVLADAQPLSRRIEPEPDHFDYLYRTRDLARLPGRKYHCKRTHVRHFMRNHSEWTFALIRPGETGLVRDFLADDTVERPAAIRGGAEQVAIARALSNLEELGLECRALFAGRRVAGIVVTEVIPDLATAMVHFEICDRRVAGAYQMINWQTAVAFDGRAEFINREQDLGLPGLRKAKRSYHPVCLLAKYSVSLAPLGRSIPYRPAQNASTHPCLPERHRGGHPDTASTEPDGRVRVKDCLWE